MGPYEIIEPIGAGGMGEVYRARDTKLKRDVALKVLPQAFANDSGRMMRFQREEEVLACVVLKPSASTSGAAERLFQHCYERMAYYKAPGWIHFLANLPTTGTQKIQKHTIYPGGIDPRTLPDVVDLRARKRRAHA